MDNYIAKIIEYVSRINASKLVIDVSTTKFNEILPSEVNNEKRKLVLLSFIREWNNIASILKFAPVEWKIKVDTNDNDGSLNLTVSFSLALSPNKNLVSFNQKFIGFKSLNNQKINNITSNNNDILFDGVSNKNSYYDTNKPVVQNNTISNEEIYKKKYRSIPQINPDEARYVANLIATQNTTISIDNTKLNIFPSKLNDCDIHSNCIFFSNLPNNISLDLITFEIIPHTADDIKGEIQAYIVYANAKSKNPVTLKNMRHYFNIDIVNNFIQINNCISLKENSALKKLIPSQIEDKNIDISNLVYDCPKIHGLDLNFLSFKIAAWSKDSDYKKINYNLLNDLNGTLKLQVAYGNEIGKELIELRGFSTYSYQSIVDDIVEQNPTVVPTDKIKYLKPSQIDDQNLNAINLRIKLPSIAGLNNQRIYFKTIASNDLFGQIRVKVLLNKYESKNSILVKDLTKVSNKEFINSIQENNEVIDGSNLKIYNFPSEIKELSLKHFDLKLPNISGVDLDKINLQILYKSIDDINGSLLFDISYNNIRADKPIKLVNLKSYTNKEVANFIQQANPSITITSGSKLSSILPSSVNQDELSFKNIILNIPEIAGLNPDLISFTKTLCFNDVTGHLDIYIKYNNESANCISNLSNLKKLDNNTLLAAFLNTNKNLFANSNYCQTKPSELEKVDDIKKYIKYNLPLIPGINDDIFDFRMAQNSSNDFQGTFKVFILINGQNVNHMIKVFGFCQISAQSATDLLIDLNPELRLNTNMLYDYPSKISENRLNCDVLNIKIPKIAGFKKDKIQFEILKQTINDMEGTFKVIFKYENNQNIKPILVTGAKKFSADELINLIQKNNELVHITTDSPLANILPSVANETDLTFNNLKLNVAPIPGIDLSLIKFKKDENLLANDIDGTLEINIYYDDVQANKPIKLLNLAKQNIQNIINLIVEKNIEINVPKNLSNVYATSLQMHHLKLDNLNFNIPLIDGFDPNLIAFEIVKTSGNDVTGSTEIYLIYDKKYRSNRPVKLVGFKSYSKQYIANAISTLNSNIKVSNDVINCLPSEINRSDLTINNLGLSLPAIQGLNENLINFDLIDNLIDDVKGVANISVSYDHVKSNSPIVLTNLKFIDSREIVNKLWLNNKIINLSSNSTLADKYPSKVTTDLLNIDNLNLNYVIDIPGFDKSKISFSISNISNARNDINGTLIVNISYDGVIEPQTSAILKLKSYKKQEIVDLILEKIINLKPKTKFLDKLPSHVNSNEITWNLLDLNLYSFNIPGLNEKDITFVPIINQANDILPSLPIKVSYDGVISQKAFVLTSLKNYSNKDIISFFNKSNPRVPVINDLTLIYPSEFKVDMLNDEVIKFNEIDIKGFDTNLLSFRIINESINDLDGVLDLNIVYNQQVSDEKIRLYNFKRYTNLEIANFLYQKNANIDILSSSPLYKLSPSTIKIDDIDDLNNLNINTNINVRGFDPNNVTILAVENGANDLDGNLKILIGYVNIFCDKPVIISGFRKYLFQDIVDLYQNINPFISILGTMANTYPSELSLNPFDIKNTNAKIKAINGVDVSEIKLVKINNSDNDLEGILKAKFFFKNAYSIRDVVISGFKKYTDQNIADSIANTNDVLSINTDLFKGYASQLKTLNEINLDLFDLNIPLISGINKDAIKLRILDNFNDIKGKAFAVVTYNESESLKTLSIQGFSTVKPIEIANKLVEINNNLDIKNKIKNYYPSEIKSEKLNFNEFAEAKLVNIPGFDKNNIRIEISKSDNSIDDVLGTLKLNLYYENEQAQKVMTWKGFKHYTDREIIQWIINNNKTPVTVLSDKKPSELSDFELTKENLGIEYPKILGFNPNEVILSCNKNNFNDITGEIIIDIKYRSAFEQNALKVSGFNYVNDKKILNFLLERNQSFNVNKMLKNAYPSNISDHDLTIQTLNTILIDVAGFNPNDISFIIEKHSINDLKGVLDVKMVYRSNISNNTIRCYGFNNYNDQEIANILMSNNAIIDASSNEYLKSFKPSEINLTHLDIEKLNLNIPNIRGINPNLITLSEVNLSNNRSDILGFLEFNIAYNNVVADRPIRIEKMNVYSAQDIIDYIVSINKKIKINPALSNKIASNVKKSDIRNFNIKLPEVDGLDLSQILFNFSDKDVDVLTGTIKLWVIFNKQVGTNPIIVSGFIPLTKQQIVNFIQNQFANINADQTILPYYPSELTNENINLELIRNLSKYFDKFVGINESLIKFIIDKNSINDIKGTIKLKVVYDDIICQGWITITGLKSYSDQSIANLIQSHNSNIVLNQDSNLIHKKPSSVKPSDLNLGNLKLILPSNLTGFEPDKISFKITNVPNAINDLNAQLKINVLYNNVPSNKFIVVSNFNKFNEKDIVNIVSITNKECQCDAKLSNYLPSQIPSNLISFKSLGIKLPNISGLDLSNFSLKVDPDSINDIKGQIEVKVKFGLEQTINNIVITGFNKYSNQEIINQIYVLNKTTQVDNTKLNLYPSKITSIDLSIDKLNLKLPSIKGLNPEDICFQAVHDPVPNDVLGEMFINIGYKNLFGKSYVLLIGLKSYHNQDIANMIAEVNPTISFKKESIWKECFASQIKFDQVSVNDLLLKIPLISGLLPGKIRFILSNNSNSINDLKGQVKLKVIYQNAISDKSIILSNLNHCDDRSIVNKIVTLNYNIDLSFLKKYPGEINNEIINSSEILADMPIIWPEIIADAKYSDISFKILNDSADDIKGTIEAYLIYNGSVSDEKIKFTNLKSFDAKSIANILFRKNPEIIVTDKLKNIYPSKLKLIDLDLNILKFNYKIIYGINKNAIRFKIVDDSINDINGTIQINVFYDNIVADHPIKLSGFMKISNIGIANDIVGINQPYVLVNEQFNRVIGNLLPSQLSSADINFKDPSGINYLYHNYLSKTTISGINTSLISFKIVDDSANDNLGQISLYVIYANTISEKPIVIKGLNRN